MLQSFTFVANSKFESLFLSQWTMRPSDDLYLLIKTFSVPEIRHFKQGAKRYGTESEAKKYLILFEAISRQQEYDEAALRKALEDVIPSSSFASWKRHLKERLEESLREFYAGRESEEKIHESLRVAELLSRRGLWRQGQLKLKACKNKAEDLDDVITLLKINEAERRILLEFGRTGIAERMRILLDEAAGFIERLRSDQDIAEVFEEACLLIRLKFDPNDRSIASRLAKLMEDPRLDETHLPTGFRARRQYHQARAFLFHLSDQLEEEYEEYQALRAHWDDHPLQKRVDAVTYKHSLTNFLHSANKTGRWEHLEGITREMAAYPAKNRDEEAEDFQTMELYRLLYFLSRGDVQAALKQIGSIEDGLTRFGDKINQARWLAFKLNIVVTFFVADKFSEANHVLQEILRHPKTDHRPDAYALARIYEPMVDMELFGSEYAQGRLHALREWLRGNDRLREFEKVVLRQLEKVFRASPSDLYAAFAGLADAMQRFVAPLSPTQGAELIYIWAAAKATGGAVRPFFELRMRKDA